MRHVALLVVFALSITGALSQNILPTQQQPVSVFVVGNFIHVLTAQNDLDFDGALDAGESPASWVTFDRATLVKTVESTFPWEWVIAGRTGFHAVSGKLYAAVGDSVAIYSLTTHELLGILDENKAYAVTVTGDGQRVYLSRRPTINAPGTVEQLTIGSPGVIPLDAGINPQMTRTYRTSTAVVGVAIVCEGVFQQNNGTVELWSAGQSGYERTTLNVGDLPNHIVIDGDKAYVTVNNSHWISVIDLVSKTIVDTIMVGTSGYDGPREAAIYDGRLYVSTFEGLVRIFDATTGVFFKSVQIGAKPEGLAIIDDQLFTTKSMDLVEFKPSSGVLVVGLDVILSVAEASNKFNTKRAIFATSNTLTLLEFDGSTALNATSMDGRSYDVHVVDAASMSIDLSPLPTGVYVITNGTTAVVVGK